MTTTIAGRRRPRTTRAACAAVGAVIVACLAAAGAAGSAPARAALLVVGCVLGTAGAAPVVRDAVRGRARPPLVMWATWAALTGLAAAASMSAGDYPSAVFSLAGTLACGAVVAVAVRAGARSLSRLDVVCLALIVPGLSLWLGLHRPAVAVLTACLIDLIGVVSALPALWRRPDQQPSVTFALICAGGVCTVCAAWGTWTVTAVAYPAYVAVSTAVMAVLSLRAPGLTRAGGRCRRGIRTTGDRTSR